MRKFIVVGVGDYMGCKPSASVVKTSLEGDEAIIHLMKKSEVFCAESQWDDFLEDMEIARKSTRTQVKALREEFEMMGDGGPNTLIYEMIKDKLILIISTIDA